MSHLRTKRCQPPGFVCLLQLPLSTDGSKYLTLLISTPTTRSSSQALQLSATLFVSQFRKEFSGAVLAHFARMLLYVKMSGLSQQTQLFLTPQKVASGLQKHESFGGCHRILGSNHQSDYHCAIPTIFMLISHFLMVLMLVSSKFNSVQNSLSFHSIRVDQERSKT